MSAIVGTLPKKCELVIDLKNAPATDGIKPQRLTIKWMLGENPSIRAELYGPEAAGQFWRKKFYNIANTENKTVPEWLVPLIGPELERVRSIFTEAGL
jgi:hypothetical protein